MKRLLALVLLLTLTYAPIAQSAQPFTIERVSTDSDGNQASPGTFTMTPTISANGRYVTFYSNSPDLVPNDTNGTYDAFVKDTLTGETTMISTDSSGVQGNDQSFPSSMTTCISEDGRYAVFSSTATNLVAGDTNGAMDVFMKDLQTNQTFLVSSDSNGNEGNLSSSNYASISKDGTKVLFGSNATNLVPNDTNAEGDIFIKDLTTGTTTIASVDVNGNLANDTSSFGSFSDDGKYVVFESGATNLVPNDNEGQYEIFVKNMETGEVTRASTDSNGLAADGSSWYATISSDGRYVGYASSATNLVDSDTNGYVDIFMKDLQTNQTIRVNLTSDGSEFNHNSDKISISENGRYVIFQSFATNAVPDDTNISEDIFVKDIGSGAIYRVSTDQNGIEANDHSDWPRISFDGTAIVFHSNATNLVDGDTNGFYDIFKTSNPLYEVLGTDTETETPETSAEAEESLADTGLNQTLILLVSATLLVFGVYQIRRLKA